MRIQLAAERVYRWIQILRASGTVNAFLHVKESCFPSSFKECVKLKNYLKCILRGFF